MKVVLRLGGHVIWDESFNIDVNLISEYSKVIREAIGKGHIVHVVIGGGPPSRAYIKALTSLDVSNTLKDYVGAMIARANAYLLASTLTDLAYIPVPSNFSEIMEGLAKGKIIVCGGLQPAQSTLAVASLIAELVRADYLVNATTVDGVYTEDPRKNPNAKRLEKVTITELKKILGRRILPGTYELFDPLSLDILLRSKMKAIVMDGKDPNNLRRLLKGEHVGTLIIPQ